MALLERLHPVSDWSKGMTPFEILVSTILSQSTTVANERRGMKGLREAFGRVTAGTLASARAVRIERAIWHAGLARQKAGRIREVARTVARDWGGELDAVLRRSPEEARRILMDFPGVGPKTADVVLAMAAHAAVFPVDTHVARIARRWDLVRTNDYAAIRSALESAAPAGKRKIWHLALIDHGRRTCKARNPLCGSCPVSQDCDWYRLHRRDGAPDEGRRSRVPRCANKGLRTGGDLAQGARSRDARRLPGTHEAPH